MKSLSSREGLGLECRLSLKKAIFIDKLSNMSDLITLSVKTLIQRVLNAAETGTADGAYDDITILPDGKD
jgi:hypothetical protein